MVSASVSAYRFLPSLRSVACGLGWVSQTNSFLLMLPLAMVFITEVQENQDIPQHLSVAPLVNSHRILVSLLTPGSWDLEINLEQVGNSESLGPNYVSIKLLPQQEPQGHVGDIQLMQTQESIRGASWRQITCDGWGESWDCCWMSLYMGENKGAQMCHNTRLSPALYKLDTDQKSILQFLNTNEICPKFTQELGTCMKQVLRVWAKIKKPVST